MLDLKVFKKAALKPTLKLSGSESMFLVIGAMATLIHAVNDSVYHLLLGDVFEVCP